MVLAKGQLTHFLRLRAVSQRKGRPRPKIKRHSFRVAFSDGSVNGSMAGPVGLLPKSRQRFATNGDEVSVHVAAGKVAADRLSSAARAISCRIAACRACLVSAWMTSTVSATKVFPQIEAMTARAYIGRPCAGAKRIED